MKTCLPRRRGGRRGIACLSPKLQPVNPGLRTRIIRKIAPRRGALQKAPDAFLLESGRLALRIRFAAERVPAAGGLGLLPSKSLSLFGIAIG